MKRGWLERFADLFGGRREPATPPDIGADLSQITWRPGASADDVADARRQLRGELPDDYLDFMASVDGGQGRIGEGVGYLILWGLNEIYSLNRSYQADIFAPGLILFGSNGIGEAYAFDTRSVPPTIVSIPFVEMALEYAVEVAPNFAPFLRALAAGWEVHEDDEA
jgi:hypothetical protein